MSLSALFSGQAITPRFAQAFGDLPASGVSRDSRTVRPGDIYVAMGESNAQAAHVAEARQRGAVAVVIEATVPGVDDQGPVFTVPNARAAFARASSIAHGLDRRCPPLIAAVGTAGKSTTVHCAWQCLGPGAARGQTLGCDGYRPVCRTG